MEKQFDKWCSSLREYWLKKDISSIIQLFDNEVEYYETPFEKVNDIETVWKDIEEQNLISLEYEIIGIKYNTVIANFIMNDNNEIVDMIYEIRLNKSGKCNYFKQWYMIQEG